mmetsp:Transcript_1199/g.1797  ORF Transcript_1199/g.1797 Transcript_1199/m.1797 type:complete len:327 (+) Transcript_1199:250-1230(+)|eukprot:CAMPEP_0204842430 /NCGR_PEP_ID=MMETSP1346-20131115/46262_1 /ASSEMBLY_ACC=CAM_ASM_000771 /TAXON_ID=215587 /ORGANISM="Aplanochytrium stocchinoi, Strain GSBS06" /LENGTH=326 /DNA_ID=CAMNT_0051981229 /DNA_START=245 /DNA_END=1225 /DNA_ORIENTATION=-
MPSQRHKISKHGTLHQADVSGAVPIQVQQVVDNCQNSNLQDFFGLAGELPPDKAQEPIVQYNSYYTLKDPQTGESWIGLTKGNNREKGTISIDLQPGQYRIELELPRQLNANFFHDFTGVVVGGIRSLVEDDPQRAEEKYKRGLPSSKLNVTVRVVGKKYGIMDAKAVMDLGTMTKFSRVFRVKQNEAPARLEIILHSHSPIKRLKVIGNVARRDFPVAKEQTPSQIRKIYKEAKVIVHEALAIDNNNGSHNSDANKSRNTSKRLDSDVDILQMIVKFYRAYAPEKVNMSDRVVEHFEGRIDEMIFSFEMKYNVRFDRRGNAAKIV